jgi:hypothetical protein
MAVLGARAKTTIARAAAANVPMFLIISFLLEIVSLPAGDTIPGGSGADCHENAKSL